MKKYLSKVSAFLLIIGGILRVAGTGAAALWFDEADLLHTSSLPFLSLFSEPTDNSGDLLLEIILRPLLALSHSVWILRLPSMLAGLVSLWLVWKLMDRLEFTLRQQIIAAALAAFLPGLLWMAQDARSYSLLTCLFLAALWFAVDGKWIGLLAAGGLTIYAHKTGTVCALTAIGVFAYLHPKELKKLALIVLGIILAWVPAMLNMFGEYSIAQPWQPNITGSSFMMSIIHAIWPILFKDPFTYLVGFLFLFMTVLLLFSRKTDNGRMVSLAAWIFPLSGLFFFSTFTHNNVIMYRTLMPMLFPFAIWLGWELGRDRNFGDFMTGLWAIAIIAGLITFNPADRGGHLDQITSEIRSQWRTGDSLIYTAATVGVPFDFYLSDLPHSWDGTLQDPFLSYPSIPRQNTVTGTPLRSWVIVPEDPLITPGEQATMNDLTNHQEPIYTIRYIQAAPINVYLVEKPWK